MNTQINFETKTETKGHKESLRGVGYVCLLLWLWWWYHGCFDYGQTNEIAHIKYVLFLGYRLYLIKLLIK